MTKKLDNGFIFVPSGIQAVHCFDLYGTIIDSVKVSQRDVDFFNTIYQKHGLSSSEAELRGKEYMDLARNEPYATGPRKGEIIGKIESILNKEAYEIRFKNMFLEDALYSMNKILDAGEGVIVFSSGEAPYLKVDLPEEISDRMGEVHGDPRKSKDPKAFTDLCKKEEQKNGRVISHTADQWPELSMALESGLFDENALIYVNRDNMVTSKEVLEKGIGQYVSDLKQVGYVEMTKK